MIDRILYKIAFSDEWGRQMRFIIGPRQAGKTTISKQKLKNENCMQLYYLWDLRSIRNRYKENELFFISDKYNSKKKLWLCFDEIHKMPKWKNILKGIFGSVEDYYQFIITISAKLNINKFAGDNLSGRYFTFHLFPLSLSELKGNRDIKKIYFDEAIQFINQRMDKEIYNQDELNQLLEYSGFPEPFIKQSKRFHKKWSEDYLDRVINEDIGSLTRIIDREYFFDIYRLIPELIGSPISYNSIASHIETNIMKVKNYIHKLCDFYLTFKISPYSKNIKRSLLKAPKIYLFDWAKITNKAKRFENYVACELNFLIYQWMDMTGEKFSLFYIRTKDKKETDFLIVKNKKPWLLVEVKLSDKTVAAHHITTSKLLGDIPIVQICLENNVSLLQRKNIYRISASKFF